VLRTLGRTSQADIARSTGLSRTTVSTLVAELKGSGLVFEDRGTHHLKGVPDEWQVFAVVR
jgi:biotin operon repressor